MVLEGKIASGPEFSHCTGEKRLFKLMIRAERKSGIIDTVPVLVGEELLNGTDYYEGMAVRITGNFRSVNRTENGKRKLILYLFAASIRRSRGDNGDKNFVSMEGYICREPTYRTTPSGMEITDLLVAVNRPYQRADYIPCICWSDNAAKAGRLPVGTRVELKGRIQSREYVVHDNGEEITRTAYELSIYYIDEVRDDEDEGFDDIRRKTG